MIRSLPALLIAAGAALAAAQPPKDAPPVTAKTGPAFEQTPFGKLPDTTDKAGKTVPGERVTEFTLTNRNGVVVKCVEYGAIVTQIHTRDKAGKLADIALGFDTLDGYLKGHPYFGSNAGRVANRIANAAFTLDGKKYAITKSDDGPHTLHGGKTGFDKKLWKGEPFLAASGPGVKFTLRSPDGDEGYPGNLSVTLSYTLTDADELVVEYRATTDKPTPCNLAHHSYFNLGGHNAGDVLDHRVEILAKNYTPADETLIPTGKIEPVDGTPFDFTRQKAIGNDLKAAGGKPVGYDLNYVLDKGTTDRPGLAAQVGDPKTGRTLQVFTTEPGLQFYSGNFLDGTNTGKGGAVYGQYNGFCMEPQKFPDSVNKPEWKGKSDVILRPGETYKQTTVYKFSTAK